LKFKADPSLKYDKVTIALVLGFFMTMVVFAMIFIFIICFFRGRTQFRDTFVSIFGQPMDLDKTKLYYREHSDQMTEKEHHVFIMNERSKK
jgi:hypothetical protein